MFEDIDRQFDEEMSDSEKKDLDVQTTSKVSPPSVQSCKGSKKPNFAQQQALALTNFNKRTAVLNKAKVNTNPSISSK